MIRKMIKTAAAVFAFAMMTAFPAYASSISSVSIDVRPEVLELAPGEMAEAVDPEVTSNGCYIAGWKTEGSTNKEMVSFYYNITLVPEGDNEFNIKSLTAYADGASQVTIKTLRSDKVELKVKCYPYFRLENVQGIEESGEGYKWRRSSHAKAYNVVVNYINDDDDEKTYSKKVTSNSIDLSSFEDVDIINVSVQAIPGSSDEEWKYLLSSEYVNWDNEVDLDESSHITSFSYPKANSSKKASSGSSHTGSASSYNNPVPEKYGWINTPQGKWWKNPDGSWPANQWVKMADGEWYLFDEKGYAYTSRWVFKDGQYYCFNDKGQLYMNTTTPDGFRVNENGEWIR